MHRRKVIECRSGGYLGQYGRIHPDRAGTRVQVTAAVAANHDSLWTRVYGERPEGDTASDDLCCFERGNFGHPAAESQMAFELPAKSLYFSRLKANAGLPGQKSSLDIGNCVQLIGPAAASFALCLLAMFALRPVAFALNLIDRPGGRKLHVGDVPVVGGLGMLLGIVLGTGLLPSAEWTAGPLLAACALLVTVGLIDDRFELSPWARLPVHIAVSLVLVLAAGASVNTLGAPFGSPIELEGVPSHAMTVLCIVAAVNAFNMLDGMDGLAGALAFVAITALAILANQHGNHIALSVSVVILGAIAAFLVSNLPFEFNREVRCFMGDSGSTLIGISVAWLCIEVSQGASPAAKPVTMLWLVAIPLYDLCWTLIRRTMSGISPFRSDHGHFHHMVLKAGIGVKGTFFLFVVLAVLLASFGIMLERLGVPDALSLAALAIAGVLIVALLCHPRLLCRIVPQSLRVPRPLLPD